MRLFFPVPHFLLYFPPGLPFPHLSGHKMLDVISELNTNNFFWHSHVEWEWNSVHHCITLGPLTLVPVGSISLNKCTMTKNQQEARKGKEGGSEGGGIYLALQTEGTFLPSKKGAVLHRCGTSMRQLGRIRVDQEAVQTGKYPRPSPHFSQVGSTSWRLCRLPRQSHPLGKKCLNMWTDGAVNIQNTIQRSVSELKTMSRI